METAPAQEAEYGFQFNKAERWPGFRVIEFHTGGGATTRIFQVANVANGGAPLSVALNTT